MYMNICFYDTTEYLDDAQEYSRMLHENVEINSPLISLQISYLYSLILLHNA